MIGDNKLDTIKDFIEKAVYFSLQVLIAVVEISVTIFLMFGSAAAIMLLYKMFPDVALIFMEPMSIFFSIIIKIFQISLVMLLLSVYGYIVVTICKILDKKFEKRREVQRKRFINDLVKKLKKEINKK